MIERRKFLAQCAAAAMTTALGPRIVLAQLLSDVEGTSPEGGFSKDYFTALLKSSFYLHDASGENQSQVKLIRVRNFPSSAKLEQFELVFSGRVATRLPEGLYTVSGWDGADFQIYIKPTVGNDRRQKYVAYFSLLR